MQTSRTDSPTPWRRPSVLFAAQVAGLIALFHGYVQLRVRPELFYHLNSAVFPLDVEFFAEFLNRPGGLVDYTSAFLSPLFACNWLGATVLTLVTLSLCLATRRFLAALDGQGGHFLFLVPALFILLLLGQYSELVRLVVGLALALVFANIYVQLGRHSAARRFAAFVITSALVYYLAGGAYVIFACLCAAYEFGVKRQFWLGAIGVLGAAALPLAAGSWLWDLSVDQAFRGLMDPFDKHWLANPSWVSLARTIRAGLILFFPIAALAAIWRWRRANAARPVNPTPPPGELAATPARVFLHSTVEITPAVGRVALVILAAGADLALFDVPKKCLLQMDYSAEHERWAEVLAHVRGVPLAHPRALDIRTVCQINRALYFTGGLLDRMFAYPQVMSPATLALVRESAETMAQTMPQQGSDILFDLGRVNESEHMAYEALEMFGNRPHILKRLVYISVLKGEPEAARKFLALLERSLLQGQWARDCRRQLDLDPLLANVPVVASRRELMVTRDSINDVEHLESMLQELLARNPRNRMAFEYLMAHYLLTRQPGKIAAHLRRLDGFDYPRLPRYLEEGLVIHFEATRSPYPDLGKHQINPETRRRAEEFLRCLDQYADDASAAFAALYRDYGDSYFFCYVFGNNCMPPAESKPLR